MLFWTAYFLTAAALPVVVWLRIVLEERPRRAGGSSRARIASMARLSIGLVGGTSAVLYYLSPWGWVWEPGRSALAVLIAGAIFSLGFLAAYALARVIGHMV
jgi:hypothetical protein